MQRNELITWLNNLLTPEKINDYCPNGLQVQGSETIKKVVTGVSATEALIDYAINQGADTVLVHHGYFWKNEDPCITAMKYQRIRKLITHNINLIAYHLPLDVHEKIGNNIQLAQVLTIQCKGALASASPLGVVMTGEVAQEIQGDEFKQHISKQLNRECLHIAPPSNKPIKTIAWCTGGGQGYIEQAALQGIDAFITGEASEQTTHVAREMDIHFFAAGHHATERYGIKALGEHLAKTNNISVEFVDIDNPV